MRIPFQHLQRLVAGDRRHLHGIQALLKEAAGGLMAEIVKGEVDQEVRIRLFVLLFAFFLVGFPGPLTRKQDGPAGGSREDLGPARISPPP